MSVQTSELVSCQQDACCVDDGRNTTSTSISTSWSDMQQQYATSAGQEKVEACALLQVGCGLLLLM